MNKKRIIYISACIILLCSLSFPAASYSYRVENPDALSSKKLSLNTEWEFFAGVFIEPFDNQTPYTCIAPVPSNWKSYNLGEPYNSGKGAGSFRLNITNLKPLAEYAFSIYDLAGTAMQVFANGKELAIVGKPSVNYEETIADQKMGLVSFSADKDGCVEILLHVSNKFHRSGGFWTSLEFGEEGFMHRLYNHKQNTTSLFLGALFTVFLYQLFLYFFRKDTSCLFLALFALAIFTRILATPFSVLKLYIPSFPYSILLRLEYTALFMAPVFYLLYIYKITGQLIPKIICKIVTAIGLAIAFIVYFLPISIGSRIVFICQIYTIAVLLFIVVFMSYHYFKVRTPITGLILLSLLVIFAGTFHDILAVEFIPIFLPDENFTPYAFLFFVFFQIAITAHQYEQTQNAVEELSKTLAETNKAYYRFVPREFLSLLSKKDITDVHLGEWIIRDMTLLCADIRNFTTISETIDGKEVFEFLNRYLMRIAPIIRDNGGFIEKYLGDGIIALFPKDGRQAFNCAVAMQKQIALLRNDFVLKGLPRIDVGIGLHYGQIVLGTVGEQDRMNEITLSKAIETVMALESLTKKYKKPVIASYTAVEKWNISSMFTIRQLDNDGNSEKEIKESIFAVADDMLEPLP